MAAHISPTRRSPQTGHSTLAVQAPYDGTLRVSTRIDASAVMVNDHTAFRVDWMPFAGLHESGLGVGGIPYTFHEMQIEKLIVVQSTALN